MKVHVINTGLFKLDGGAMFGVVPKTMWQKLNPPDENNLCTWAMRCLLVETADRKILIDTGMGNKQDDKFRSHFHPHGNDTLMNSLAEKGFSAADITDVFLTHLHFDHCGGAVVRDEDGHLKPAFPNAVYWTNKVHYDWAYKPNPREAASFLKENFVPLEESGVLRYLDIEQEMSFLPGFNIYFAYGHTEAMMLPILDVNGRKLFYCADLMPSEYHIGMPYVMGYDLRPLETMKEKDYILNRAVDENWVLVYEHSPHGEAAIVTRNDSGRIVLKQAGTLSEIVG